MLAVQAEAPALIDRAGIPSHHIPVRIAACAAQICQQPGIVGDKKAIASRRSNQRVINAVSVQEERAVMPADVYTVVASSLVKRIAVTAHDEAAEAVVAKLRGVRIVRGYLPVCRPEKGDVQTVVRLLGRYIPVRIVGVLLPLARCRQAFLGQSN